MSAPLPRRFAQPLIDLYFTARPPKSWIPHIERNIGRTVVRRVLPEPLPWQPLFSSGLGGGGGVSRGTQRSGVEETPLCKGFKGRRRWPRWKFPPVLKKFPAAHWRQQAPASAAKGSITDEEHDRLSLLPLDSPLAVHQSPPVRGRADLQSPLVASRIGRGKPGGTWPLWSLFQSPTSSS